MCCRVAQWLVFSDVWNAIVDELRTVDLISDGEQRNLSFVHLPIDDSIQVPLHSHTLPWGRDTQHCVLFLRAEGLQHDHSDEVLAASCQKPCCYMM